MGLHLDNKTPEAAFTWVSFYEELATKLLPYRERQGELVAYLESLKKQGLTITPLEDWDSSGKKFLLEEMDPFTFFGVFNRNLTAENRIRILEAMKERFEIPATVPKDFSGIPILNNMKSWFMAAKEKRTPTHVPMLWRVFELALGEGDPTSQPEFAAAFDEALTLRNVNFNLTMGLFWIRPRKFVSLDGVLREYLSLKTPPGGLSSAFYINALLDLRAKHPEGFPKLSYEAWLSSNGPVVPGQKPASHKKSLATPPPSDVDYWFVGAFWDGVEPHDQTARFLEEGVWENGYEDKYLDVVKTIKAGDKIAIKAATTQKNGLPFDNRGRTASKMLVKATGTVVKNRNDGRTVEVEWNPNVKERSWYFYTQRLTVWRLNKLDELAKRLIRFAFHGELQDYEFFLKTWNPTAGGDPYEIQDAIAEGVFVPASELERIRERLLTKKNIVLQGAPGVGKTFLARKLAYILMGEQDDSRILSVQFHPSYSYEDFVRGYRPTNEAGKFALLDGPLLNLCSEAAQDVDRPYVLLIDEINRGVTSQIFGEFLSLMEADKRGPKHAVVPIYRRKDNEKISIPENVYLIGTMNIADRSLALVDFALRRRFAFVGLEPRFDDRLKSWLSERGMSSALIGLIVDTMTILNQRISTDSQLGPSYMVGHSFFCPRGKDFSKLDRQWFDDIVRTEVLPLLEEYWYDAPDKVKSARGIFEAKS